MKEVKKLFILLTIVLLISGCSMKAEYNMNVKKDKSLDFSVITAMDDELIEGLLSMNDSANGSQETDEETKKTYTDEEKWAMLEDSATDTDEDAPEKQGFTKARFEDGKFKGFKYTKTIASIDDISGEKANFTFDNFQKISDSTLFIKEGKKYKAKLKLSSGDNSSDYSSYNVGINMIYTITLPEKPISHNATTVSEDGKTLTWNLTEVGAKDIEFQFQLSNNMLLPIIAIGTLALFIIILIIIIIRINKSKKKNNSNEIVEQLEVSNEKIIEPIESTNSNPDIWKQEPTPNSNFTNTDNQNDIKVSDIDTTDFNKTDNYFENNDNKNI